MGRRSQTETVAGVYQALLETESNLWACHTERATLTCADHWQAGFSGRATIYPDEVSYRGALARERQCFEAAGSCRYLGDPGEE